MAEVKVSKEGSAEQGKREIQTQRAAEQEQTEGALAQRGEIFPSLFSISPTEVLSASPFSLMRRFTEEMDRAFANFGFGNRESLVWLPPVEVFQTDGDLVVTAELPGLNKEDVTVAIIDGYLVIQGERKREQEEQRGEIQHSERSYGRFYRSIALPDGANVERARAEFKNGVLEIRIPVPQEERKSREIPIEATGDGGSAAASQGTGQTQSAGQAQS